MSLHFVSGKQQTAVLHKVYLYFYYIHFLQNKITFWSLDVLMSSGSE